uniref:[histone H3]-dimethyl-L-lysine(36) demethylase n=1 Tax=Denticeps clupeoides TaxID=299321 RepID=A0AAY4BTH6_9TELE
MAEPQTRYSKRLRTGTRRRYQDDGISDDEIEGKRTFDLHEKLMSDKFNSDLVKRMEGKDFTFEYIQQEGLRDPLVFENADGLGIKWVCFYLDFMVSEINLCSRRVIDVMDVNTQKGIEMSMGQWGRYYETPASEREKLYNVISLEFSHTKLENLVKRPASVDMIDWVDNMWPRHLKERQRDSTNAIIDMQYPKVQKYCLMSVEGCFTDFHIDFGGTSVWYHILRGGKVFWLIPPSPQNLELYENWVLSGKQGDIFLGDKASHCQRIELKQGYTFMIPSGWIHAVYTPIDTLVFGGNFLHSFNIPMQLNIYNIEDRTRVPAKFRHPFYYEMCWYVLERYLYCLTSVSYLTPEFQKHSLGIGLKREDFVSPDNENGHAPAHISGEEEEEEKDEEFPAPPPLGKVHLTPFELEGLWHLLKKLEELPSHKQSVPAGIRNAAALLSDMRTLLLEHAQDNPKLSYTGTPIVQWPKRPSWYRPPTPPPSVLYQPHPPGPALPPTPRPSKRHSSMSALRRRRVRCKSCAACVRPECGDCAFCRDMKKFGGPGRLKQTCVLRQCLAPTLPLTALCDVCGEGTPEGEATAQTLMECSSCGKITHPECVQASEAAVINKDLPSCWECPTCVQGTRCDEVPSTSSSSDEDRKSSVPASPVSSAPPAKRAHREGIGVKDGRKGRRPLVPPRRLSPPSQRLQENSRRAGALELQLRNRIKLERNKILQSVSRVSARSDWSASPSPPAKSSSPGGGGDSKEEELQEEGQRGGKENRPQEEEEEEDESEDGERDGEEEGAEEENGREAGVTSDCGRPQSSCLTVTLQRPSRGHRDPNAIVPKLEAAVCPLSPATRAASYILNKSLLRQPLRSGSAHSDKSHASPLLSGRPEKHFAKSVCIKQGHTRTGRGLQGLSRTRPHSQCLDRRSPVSPSVRDVSGGGPAFEKEVWVSVFRYLSRTELCVCMAVCRSWYRWGCDKRLWTRISLSRCPAITPQALSGIIKRQPVSLDLSWTSISKKQLTWLINRLPGLKDLVLSGCSWISVSALSSSSCPLLRTLDLGWVKGLQETQIRELLSPPGCDNRSQLRNLQCLRLCGLDVSEATLRMVIRHTPLLTRLELSHCPVTDHALNLLTAVGSSTRNTLAHLNLAGCSKLTDRCLVFLKRLACVSYLDLRGCKGVSRCACETFISELSVNTLYCLSDDKLIQRIS